MTDVKLTWSMSTGDITESSIDGERFITMPAAKFNALANRIADLERDNNLLREVFEAAKQVGNQAVLFQGYYTISSQYVDKLLIVTQNAMNGVNVEAK